MKMPALRPREIFAWHFCVLPACWGSDPKDLSFGGDIHLQCTLRIIASGHLLSVKLVTTYNLPSIRSSTFCTLGHLISLLTNWWKAPLVFHLTVNCPGMWDLKSRVRNPGLGHGQIKGSFCRGANTISESRKVSRNFLGGQIWGKA